MNEENYFENKLSNCCKSPIMSVSGDEGTGFMLCRKCRKGCNISVEKKCEHPKHIICEECKPLSTKSTTKCEPDGLSYLSNPPQSKCKNCGTFWFSHENTPTCRVRVMNISEYKDKNWSSPTESTTEHLKECCRGGAHFPMRCHCQCICKDTCCENGKFNDGHKCLKQPSPTQPDKKEGVTEFNYADVMPELKSPPKPDTESWEDRFDKRFGIPLTEKVKVEMEGNGRTLMVDVVAVKSFIHQVEEKACHDTARKISFCAASAGLSVTALDKEEDWKKAVEDIKKKASLNRTNR